MFLRAAGGSCPDTTAPNTTLTAPTGIIADSTPTIVPAADGEPRARFLCKVDAGPFVACGPGPTELAELSEGSHTVAVAAADPLVNLDGGLANVDPTPATASFTVDVRTPWRVSTAAPRR